MRKPSILHAVLIVLSFLPFTGCGGSGVCEGCIPTSFWRSCYDGLVCRGGICVRPDGNLPGECCEKGPSEDQTYYHAVCSEENYCVYKVCESTPVFPPPKELIDHAPELFLVDENTQIIIPEFPSPMEETSGQVLQAQIQESYGLDVIVRNYTTGDPAANSIVLGTTTSNPAVQTLVTQFGVTIPDEEPLPDENYSLKVVPDNILVAGRGNPGVIFGSQALKQYIRGVAKKDPSGILGALTINDYPDTEQRMFFLILNHYIFPYDHNADPDGEHLPYKWMDINFHLDTAYKYIHLMSEFRYNINVLKMGDIVAWNNMPQPENVAITPNEYMDLVRESNRYGMEVIPLLNGSSAHYGWIGTVENPVEYTPEYCLLHVEDHLVIFKALIQEIIDAFEPVQPLRYFHAGMDEDWSFGYRTQVHHMYWIDEVYNLLAANNVKTMIWSDNFLLSAPNYIDNADPDVYPDMHLMFWDYNEPLPPITMPDMKYIASKGIEVSWGLHGNGLPSEFRSWFYNHNPYLKGFMGMRWTRSGTICQEDTSVVYLDTVYNFMRKHARQFWWAASY